MSKRELQKKLIDDVKSILLEPFDDDLSRVKQIIRDDRFTSHEIKALYNDVFLNSAKYKLFSKKQEYEKELNEYELSSPYTVECGSNVDGESGDLFQVGIVLIGIIIIGLIIYQYYIHDNLPRYTVRVIGISVIITLIVYVLYQYIDILNNSFQSSTECDSQFKNLIEIDIHNLLKRASNESSISLDINIIHKFITKYLDYSSSMFNSHVASKQVIEDFIEQHKQFFLKSENVSLSHTLTATRADAFLDFIYKPDRELLHQTIQKLFENSSAQQDQLINNTRKKFSTRFDDSTLTKYLSLLEDDQDIVGKLIVNDKAGNKHEIYNFLCDTFIASVRHLMSYQQGEETNRIKDIVRVNSILKLFKLGEFPEYEELSERVLYPHTIPSSVKELSMIYNSNDRYTTITNEVESFSEMKKHLLRCVTSLSSENNDAFHKACIKNKNIANEIERTTRSIGDALEMITNDNKQMLSLGESYIRFTKDLHTRVITKEQLLGKGYENMIKIISIHYQETFSVMSAHYNNIIEYVFNKAQKNSYADSNAKRFFTHNLRNILSILKKKIKETDLYKKVIQDKDRSFEEKNKYVISFDQFLQKVAHFDKDDMSKLATKYHVMRSEADNVIQNYHKTLDRSPEKRIRVFQVAIKLYAFGSLMFILDYAQGMLLPDEPDAITNGKSVGGANLLKKTKSVTKRVANSSRDFVASVAKGLTSTQAVSDALDRKDASVAEGLTSTQAVSDATTSTTSTASDDTRSTQASGAVPDARRDKAATGTGTGINVPESDTGIKVPRSDTTTQVDAVYTLLFLSCIWLLSWAMLTSYWMKLDSDLQYNAMIVKNNSLKLEITLKKLSQIASELNDTKDGKVREQKLKELYDQSVILLDLETKCQVIRPTQGVGGNTRINHAEISFPWNEISISMLMISFIIAILILQYKFNNPFEILENLKHLRKSKNFKEKRTDTSNYVAKGGGTGGTKPDVKQVTMLSNSPSSSSQRSAMLIDLNSEMDADSLRENLSYLQELDSKLLTGSNSSVAKLSVAGAALMISLVLSYTIFNNALKYKHELFNGSLFSQSRCW
jgi:hypothetical protein